MNYDPSTMNYEPWTMKNTLFYLIIYDVPDSKAGNKRRTRLHKLLSGYGKWTQYSVFECFLTAMQFAKLQISIEKLIKPDEDSVRVYVLDAGAVKRTITYGSEQPRQDKAIILYLGKPKFSQTQAGAIFRAGSRKTPEPW